jgi:hypothetical protein
LQRSSLPASSSILELPTNSSMPTISGEERGPTLAPGSARLGKKLGHDVIGLLDQDDMALIGHGLLKECLYADKSGIVENDAHMTPLGIKFCQNIEEYRIESADERRGSQ